MDGTGILLEQFVKELSNSFQVTTVTYPITNSGSYDELYEIARASVPKVGNYIVIGESFSGPIALMLAASRPRGLVGVVLCCSFAKNPRRGLTGIARLAKYISPRLIPKRILNRLVYDRWATPILKQKLLNILHMLPNETWRARLMGVICVDVTEIAKIVDVPVLYLRASRDHLVPHRVGEELRKIFSSLQVSDLDGPHFLLQASPVEAATRIARFAGQL